MAIVTNIQGYSIHDGPGIRTTVFLKGCPLRCRWCANPENLSYQYQVGFLAQLCRKCGRCLSACPENALTAGEKRITRPGCTDCGACISSCLYGALVGYGQEMSARQVFDRVRRDKMFYDTSGGGVTVSGGEPLTHPDFVEELFRLCRGEGIHTCAETCGFVPRQYIDTVLPFTDQFYFDLKLVDSAKHIQYTGQDNGIILDNARYLAEKRAAILFRQPLIPGVNDDEDSIRGAAVFIRSLGRQDVGLQLMPYHRMGLPKYLALDMAYSMADVEAVTPPQADKAAELYRYYGVDCTVSQ